MLIVTDTPAPADEDTTAATATERYPILEYDPYSRPLINPFELLKPLPGMPTRCVATFFQDVIKTLVTQQNVTLLTTLYTELTPFPVYALEHRGQRIAVYHAGLGSSLSAAVLDEVIALGGRTFIACGGCGVLDKQINVGDVIVPVSAVRDEGTSYHYLPPGREVEPDAACVAAMQRVLDARRTPYLLSKTWTTDAIYRETADKVKKRKEEGCKAVDMEAAAFFAVAKHRGVRFGQLLYGGDDVSGDGDWKDREWRKHQVREKLFWIAADAVLEVEEVEGDGGLQTVTDVV